MIINNDNSIRIAVLSPYRAEALLKIFTSIVINYDYSNTHGSALLASAAFIQNT